jgi:uncharacterized cupredoxin-like copper-binding protein
MISCRGVHDRITQALEVGDHAGHLHDRQATQAQVSHAMQDLSGQEWPKGRRFLFVWNVTVIYLPDDERDDEREVESRGEKRMLCNTRYCVFLLIILFLVTVVANPVSAAEQDEYAGAARFGHPGDGSHVDRTIEITAVDLAFKPGSVTVQRGQTVKFVVTDRGKLTHAFVIGPELVQQEHDKEMLQMTPQQRQEEMAKSPNGLLMQPGQTKTLVWTFDTPLDQLQYACHVPGHYQAGMRGTISIRPQS